MNILQTEPAAVLALIGTIIVGALQQIADSGLVNGSGPQILGIVITLVPIVIGFITRSIVSSPATVAAITAAAAAPTPPAP